MLNRLLEGFEGKLTPSKWEKIAKTSRPTATRDINDLIKRGILNKMRLAAAAPTQRSES